ncbi:MAG: hypothetical protein M1825_003566 [Sarcosagium campestre]|nr:MAG: hypothetical protein M1825_003566 [Sarcosagium campestre]
MADDDQGRDLAVDKAAEAIFSNVRFTIIESKDLSAEFAKELTTLLIANGGEVVQGTPFPDVTHIVSATIDFPEYTTATDALIPVVKPEWITTSIARKRLNQLRPFSPDPRMFFAGVTICCSDLPPGDKDAIIGGVLAIGGQYSGHLTRLVTHIVALSEEGDRCQQALAKRLRCKIVLPHWFDDCLKLGKRIDERPYTLPDPELTRAKADDPVRLPSDRHLIGASSPRTDRLPILADNPSPNRQNLSVFSKQNVMLDADLELGARLRGTIEELIVKAGGTVTGNVDRADVLICHYREALAYRAAIRANKQVGNLPWLYYLITHNTWTSPLRRLLHYPIARGGLPGFSEARISVSNYGGEARLYLENLIQAAGGEYTKTMRQDNTHLITARPHSEKCMAAKEWNIHMVNHLWLEESYAKWEVQSMSNPRYTHFPARTNLGEVVGQTPIDRQAIEADFDGEDDMPVLDPELQGGMLAIELKTGHKDGGTHLAQRISDGSPVPKAARFQKPRLGSITPKTPKAGRFIVAEKENETPGTTSSREAKDRAALKLHDLATDIALYEKQKKRTSGGIWGGRQGITESSVVKKRRSASISEADEDSSATEADNGRGLKRKKLTPPVSIRLVLTSYARWIGQLEREIEEKRRLRELGILVIQDPASCTHLAAPSIVRTQKFICTLALAPVIVSTHFVDHCLDKHELPRPERYLLKDTEAERRLGFKLKDAVRRAGTNKRHLLRGKSIYCTANVHGGFDTYKAIVAANGGQCMLFRARPGAVRSRAVGMGDRDDEEAAEGDDVVEVPEVIYLLSGDTDEERKLWPRFKGMAQENGMRAKVVKTDWLLDVTMAQELRDASSYEIDGEAD